MGDLEGCLVIVLIIALIPVLIPLLPLLIPILVIAGIFYLVSDKADEEEQKNKNKGDK